MSLIMRLGSSVIPLLLLFIPAYGVWCRTRVLDAFVEGAEEGLRTVLRIAPHMIAMFAALASFRASGLTDLLANALGARLYRVGLTPEILTLAFLRPVSGSGAMAVTSEILQKYGPDSFLGLLASTIQGGSDTTFYVVALYCGAVGVANTRHCLLSGLLGDTASVLCAIVLCNLLFGAG